ncbi:MAG: TetR/AcrR family transcriptional regulator [Deltaproteobacteria bacterium]|nr:TetR/AcrR family transcriptional regulator [Deltaproteobacteria bacterium]
MARPVNADAEATRRRILDSAVKLFSARGLEGATVRDVALGAGVTLATVHHYFGSKDALFEACIAAVYDGLEGMSEELKQLFVTGAPLEEILTRAMAVASGYARKNRTIVRLLVRTSVSTGRVPPRGRVMMETSFLPVVAEALGMLTGRSALEVRLALQTLVFLVTRYAVQDPAELVSVLGLPKGERERAFERLDAHLGQVALALLAPRPDTGS